MLTVKSADKNWQFGKVISVFGDNGTKFDALILGIKEFTTNALLLKRSKSNLVGSEALKFEMPKAFFVKTKWGQNQTCLSDEPAGEQATTIDL